MGSYNMGSYNMGSYNMGFNVIGPEMNYIEKYEYDWR